MIYPRYNVYSRLEDPRASGPKNTRAAVSILNASVFDSRQCRHSQMPSFTHMNKKGSYFPNGIPRRHNAEVRLAHKAKPWRAPCSTPEQGQDPRVSGIEKSMLVRVAYATLRL